MRLKDKTFTREGIVHLSDVLPAIGIVDTEAADAFTENISTISWGDASYTLLTIREFYLKCIKHSFQVQIVWPEFEKMMSEQEVEYINMEG